MLILGRSLRQRRGHPGSTVFRSKKKTRNSLIFLNSTAARTFNRHQPKSCISSLFALTEPTTVGRSHLRPEPLVLLLLICLQTRKQTPGDWPTVRPCLFTLETRVHTSELRHTEPRLGLRGNESQDPGEPQVHGAELPESEDL